MSTLNYKGYQATVSYEGGVLAIHVLHVDDFLTTECESASEVKSSFEALIDDYLETCAELGREPNKPFKGTFNVRISPELHKQAAMAAANNSQSLNAWISESIQEKLDNDQAKKMRFANRFFQSKKEAVSLDVWSSHGARGMRALNAADSESARLIMETMVRGGASWGVGGKSLLRRSVM